MLDELIRDFVPLDIEKLRPDGFYENFFGAKENDVNRVENGSGWENWDRCPICGSDNREAEFSYLDINIVRCPECTHRYTDRVPVNLDEVYDSTAYLDAIKTLELQQQDYRANRFGMERVELVKGLFNDTNRSVLDVGCGWGYFLGQLQTAGFDCYGIELSKPVAEIAREKYNLNISSTPIQTYETEVPFDLITLFGVIEHIKEPVDFLGHCRRLLKESGFILLFTPNFESVAVHVQKERANMVYPGQHIHHFTLKSMKKLGELNHMSVASSCTKGIDVGDICGYYKYLKKYEIAAFLQKNATVLQSVIDQSACGNHMRVILQN
ncbi:MAG: class I SAM-dependent methyltransferase [Deltaproteobacteria bacterium]|nr:class I SAM-dependent methyltransferase [Deltaproteobacteria bacterium]